MATKQGRTGIWGFFAFGAMFLNFISWCIQAINNLGWIEIGGTVVSAISAIASLALVAVVLWVAYDFARKQKKIWRTFYWVLAILTILSILVGVGANFAK